MDISNRYMPVALEWIDTNIMYRYTDVTCTLHSNNHTDINKHIDASIAFTTPTATHTSTWQIKTITDMTYNHFTIEYYNNRFSKEWGEIKEIEADLYLHCRVADDGNIYNVGLVNVSKFKEAYDNNLFSYHICNNPDSNANFLCVDWDELKQIKGVVLKHVNTMHLYDAKHRTKILNYYKQWIETGVIK